ncbi:c-type cytochrome [Pseudobacter ginsenosidimutans]|uniref:Cytochrome c n=1 Tax=Pseudobacter ginsenosidimutans TaxID=661488 RepID=A0A4Q7MST1_9BACT|nr:c-type cytochrome [Pseudobacter ginsenosidimutans]QEC41344.1 cytochrome c class I [Pseudobacter ginsenosidimutans]RZS71882.1 cytochrome c [Pseudobacter ginsenosidimutans]
MKKLMVVCALGAGLMIYACGGTENKTAEKKEEKTEKKTAGSDADAEKALEMIASLDCTTCHKINEKVIGPSYVEVANKYEASDAVITDLSNKIIKGGQGVYGTVPMTPHPNLSMDSAKVMVKYILSLKKQ